MKQLLKNAFVYQNGLFEKCDVSIFDDVIHDISVSISNCDFDFVYDFNNNYLIPGFADVHIHLREPGFSYKETVSSGTLAAAKGGYNVLCAMPNVNPPPDCMENLRLQLELIEKNALVHVLPYACITRGQLGTGECVDFESMKDFVAGFSDDGRGVQDDSVMEKAMMRVAGFDGIIAAHCEVNELLNGGYIHLGRYSQEHHHKGICSQSEYEQIDRDIKLSEKTGCRYHVCHISTKESVELIRRAKQRGVRVTCETAPHYLTLCEDDLQEDGRFKMNPPLRGREDKQALIEGVCDGTIDIIATDHAPHSRDEKARGLQGSAMGVVGLETAFPILYTELVQKGVITLSKLIEMMSVRPREIFKLGGGKIEIGAKADFALLDLNAKYTIDSETFFSKGRATPFDGWNVQGENIMTMIEGKKVWEKNSIKK